MTPAIAPATRTGLEVAATLSTSLDSRPSSGILRSSLSMRSVEAPDLILCVLQEERATCAVLDVSNGGQSIAYSGRVHWIGQLQWVSSQVVFDAARSLLRPYAPDGSPGQSR